MGPVHARDNGPGVPVLSGNVPLGTGSYYIPVGLSIRPNRNRVPPLPKGIYPEITTYPTGGRVVGVPVYPTKTPGGLQVESQV